MKISKETWDLFIKEHVENKLSVKKIAKKYNMRYGTIYYGLKAHGITPQLYIEDKRRFIINDSYFDVIDTHKKAYILGLLLADGSAQKKTKGSNRVYIKLQSKDEYILDVIRKEIAPEYKITKGSSTIRGKIHYNSRLEIASNRLVERLHELGMVQDKFLRTIPKLDEKFNGSLIRGIFDGDGSISKTKRKGVANSHQIYIAGSNQEFITQLQELIGFGKLYLNKRDGRDMLFLRFNSSDEKLMLYFHMYEDTSMFLKRKKEIYTKYVNTVLSSGIKKSEPA